jgi:hypothetical protein
MNQTIRVPAGACLLALLAVTAAAPAEPPRPGDQPEVKKDVREKGLGPETDEEHRREAERLVSGIDLERLVEEKWVKVKRIEKALLYHGDATRGHNRGSVWAWGDKGRPVALLELWQNGSNRTKWVCGLCNTSGGALRARREDKPWWKENESTVELKDVPGAAAPVEDAPLRQRQLKQLAQKFTGYEFWDPNNSRYELRRLERAVHTYRDPDAGILDGGMYVLANGTNPEVMLFIEARTKQGAKSPLWQFTVGRMTHAEYHLEYDDKEVLSAPPGKPLSGAGNPYWVVSVDAPVMTEPKK